MQGQNMQPKKKYKIGYVPGVYDLFHIGHLNLLRRSKELSEYLIAGVLTDELVEHFKGKKPYIPFEERREIVAAINGVDEVMKVDFTNTVKMDAWNLYHYDAYFSGDDHEHDWDREKKALQAVGSDIVFLPYTQSTSSTMIKKQIEKSPEKKRLYLFGAGKIGQRMLNELKAEKKYDEWEVAGFVDNASEKHLTRILGAPVYKPEDLKTLESEGAFSILVTMKETDAIMKQLAELDLTGNVVRNL